MKCPKCKKQMKVDIANNCYTCKCGKEIKWSEDKDYDDNCR